MYSKNAKWKQVLGCCWLDDETLKTISVSHSIYEGYTNSVIADYYWTQPLGLYVIIDTKGKGDVLQWYKNYHMLDKSMIPYDNLIWSLNRD